MQGQDWPYFIFPLCLGDPVGSERASATILFSFHISTTRYFTRSLKIVQSKRWMNQDINLGLNPVPMPLEYLSLYKMFTEHFPPDYIAILLLKLDTLKAFYYGKFLNIIKKQSD